MALEQMQAAGQDPKPGKKLQLRKETVRELKHGRQNAPYPSCEDGGDPASQEETAL